MEFHVRKVREVETGGRPTGFLEPLIFELNSSMTAFSMNGKPLFDDLFVKLQGTQTTIQPDEDLNNVF